MTCSFITTRLNINSDSEMDVDLSLKYCIILTHYYRTLYVTFSLFFWLSLKYLGNRWTDLRQIHREDTFGPLLGRVWMSRSKVKGQDHQGQKNEKLLSHPHWQCIIRRVPYAVRCKQQ